MTVYATNDDFLPGGTSLKGMSGVSFEGDGQTDPFAGLLTEGTYRYNPLIIPGMPGEVPDVGPVLDAFDFTVGPFIIEGADRPDFLAKLAAVRALFVPVNFIGTRRLTSATTPFYVDDSANCRYGGLAVIATISPREADVLLTVRNLDGSWS